MKTLAQFVEDYLRWAALTKSALTVAKERSTLRGWCSGYGDNMLDAVTSADVEAYALKRRESGVCARTVNLDILALAGVYKRAKREGIVSASPTDGWEPLRHQAPKRPLWSEEDIQKLVNAAACLNTNPQLVVDYLLFLALSGARRREALSLRWEDIDFQRWTVNFSRDTKYGKARTLDMSNALFKHLTAMHSRRCNQKPSPWLFPSPARVNDQPARDLSDSVEQARRAAGLESLRLHDLRHAFLSRGVMAGVDYMTLAQWAGHSDGGVLIGKVYGHLSDDHRKRMAQRM